MHRGSGKRRHGRKVYASSGKKKTRESLSGNRRCLHTALRGGRLQKKRRKGGGEKKVDERKVPFCKAQKIYLYTPTMLP